MNLSMVMITSDDGQGPGTLIRCGLSVLSILHSPYAAISLLSTQAGPCFTAKVALAPKD